MSWRRTVPCGDVDAVDDVSELEDFRGMRVPMSALATLTSGLGKGGCPAPPLLNRAGAARRDRRLEREEGERLGPG